MGEALESVYLYPVRVVTPLGNLAQTWDVWSAGRGEGRVLWECGYGALLDTVVGPVEVREGDECGGGIALGWGQVGVGVSTPFIYGSTKGNIDSFVKWVEGGRIERAPSLWEEADSCCRRMNLGKATVVSAACATGLVGVMEAALRVRSGEVEQVVVMAVDAVTEFVVEGFRSLKAIAGERCRPFDKGRDGLALGYGGALCVVSGTPLPGFSHGGMKICGYGVASDAVHMTAPDREGRGLARAMRDAIEMAGIGAEEIEVVVAHGTGTKYNDAMEAVAYGRVFGGHRPAVTGVKGLIGHSLGASGLVELALLGNILREEVVPGVVGLEESAFPGLDLVRGVRGLARKARYGMKVAAGFGGLNGAVVVEVA